MPQRILHIKDYPDLIRRLPFTSVEIRQTIENYHLDFLPNRNREVEFNRDVPMFAYSFYDFIFSLRSIPTQEEAFGYYLSTNKETIEKLLKTASMADIKARFNRAYPSLMRDYHFNKLVSEQLPDNYTALYNVKLDVEEGIDLLIITPRTNYGICLYTDTSRGNDGRKWKSGRHDVFDNVTYIEHSINLNEAEKVGDFLLYGKKNLDDLLSLIREKELIGELGHCIRCGEKIPFASSLRVYKEFYCAPCFERWERYSNAEYNEAYCHVCGKRVSGITAKRPLCRECWQREKNRFL